MTDAWGNDPAVSGGGAHADWGNDPIIAKDRRGRVACGPSVVLVLFRRERQSLRQTMVGPPQGATKGWFDKKKSMRRSLAAEEKSTQRYKQTRNGRKHLRLGRDQ